MNAIISVLNTTSDGRAFICNFKNIVFLKNSEHVQTTLVNTSLARRALNEKWSVFSKWRQRLLTERETRPCWFHSRRTARHFSVRQPPIVRSPE